MDKNQSKDTTWEAAKKYVDQQLETMKKFGSAPKELSSTDYNSLIKKIAAASK